MSAAVYTIDLGRCIACHACAIACRDRADLPDSVAWLRVESCEAGRFPQPSVLHRVVHCFHCARPPCVPACPEGALKRNPEGLVELDGERCRGCGRCVRACPFSAIAVLPDGSASKCDGCADEIAQGLAPTCVRACPMAALGWGAPGPVPVRRTRDEGHAGHEAEPAVVYWRR